MARAREWPAHRGDPVSIDGSALTVDEMMAVNRGGAPVRLADEARVRASRDWIDEIRSGERLTVYGINTGYGSLAEVRIPRDDVATLARNLILSHSVNRTIEISHWIEEAQA